MARNVKNKSRRGMSEQVWPIKSAKTVRDVENFLYDHFQNKKHRFTGRRDYTIFQVGKATLLRGYDVLSLKYADVYDGNGRVRHNAFITDHKTGKKNTLYLKPVRQDLEDYRDYRAKHGIKSPWLFPSSAHPEKHITRRQFYKIMKTTGEWLGIQHLGTHTMRKTGAYEVYAQTGNLALVQHLLNHSSEWITLRYLGLNAKSITNTLDHVTFY